jgi:hypothetical protein
MLVEFTLSFEQVSYLGTVNGRFEINSFRNDLVFLSSTYKHLFDDTRNPTFDTNTFTTFAGIAFGAKDYRRGICRKMLSQFWSKRNS